MGGCCTDIHDQKLMVQELLPASEEQAALSDQSYRAYRLAQSQRETFHTLFRQAPALIAILRGPQHVFGLANLLYEQLLSTGRELATQYHQGLIDEARRGFNRIDQGGEALVAVLQQLATRPAPFAA